MRVLLIGTMAFALAGCTKELYPAASPPGNMCDAARAAAFVGRDGAAVAEDARVAAGARSVRIYGPDQPVTMDFRPDRLNLETDVEGKVVKAKCG